MNKKHAAGTPLSNSEVSAFCGQISLILKAGISSIEGISIMLEDAGTEEDKAILQKIYDKLMETGSMHEALSTTELFPQYMLQMVEIGETTGTLDDVMEQLNIHYEREDSIARSIKSAVTYPLIMAGMMVIVIIVLLVEVMPIFNQVFIQLGTEMTGFSGVLMDIGNTISTYSAIFIALLILVICLALFGVKSPSGRKFVRSIGCKLPSVRSVYENTAACRFASGMALTLSSGLDTEQSMKLAGALNEDPLFQEKINICYQRIEEGADLYEAIHTSGIFSGIYTRMASLGAKTGTMDKVLDEIAARYQDEVDNRMNNILAVLEPTLVIILSLIVGIILLSVMLPLMGIMSSI